MIDHETYSSRAYRRLLASSAVYVVGLVLHTADHVRRGLSVMTGAVAGAGAVSTVAGLIIVGMILVENRHAPLAAAVFGPTTVIGVAIVHIPPRWGAFSDPFIGSTGTGVTAFSWAVVLLEMVGLLAMAIAGLAVVRQQSREVVRDEVA